MKAEMPPVDLSLAVNYLPACLCLLKTGMLTALLLAIHGARAGPAYVTVVSLLLMDRLMHPAAIVDSSGVLLMVCGAHLVTEVRTSGVRYALPAAMQWVIGAEWAALAGCLLWEVHGPAPGLPRLRRYHWGFALTLGHVSLLALLSAEEEARLALAARYLGFALLCLSWLYVMGVYRRRLVQQDSQGVHFATYFAPVLLLAPLPAMLYAAFCAGTVAAHLRSASPAPAHTVVACASPASPRPAPGPSLPAPALLQDEDESPEEVERVYREALLRRGAEPRGAY